MLDICEPEMIRSNKVVCSDDENKRMKIGQY